MATNLIMKDGRYLSVAATDPTTPASGDPVRLGILTGVAQGAEGADIANEASVDFGNAVYDMSVKGINDAGNSAVAKGDLIYHVDADTPKLSKKASGYLFGVALEAITSGSTDTINVLHLTNPGTAVGAGTVNAAAIATGVVDETHLKTNLAVGFISLDIGSLRIIASNVIGNTTEGMLLDGNTAPSFQRVNGATDKALRVIWAASSSIECQFPPIPKPPDLDGAASLTVRFMLGKDTNTDTSVTMGVAIFDGVADTNAGGNTAALAAAALAEYSVTLDAGDLAEDPGFLNIGLTPGTHTTDAIWLYAAWIEYARKG
jgi:hypothetical protein